MSYHDLIAAYEVDVQFPDVSGMELLDMLLTRSEIAANEAHLSEDERRRVVTADRTLLRQAKQVCAAIQKIADLASWRHNNNFPVAHWWWYLDVVTQLPVTFEWITGLTQANLDLAPVNA